MSPICRMIALLLPALLVGCSSMDASYHYAKKQLEHGDVNFHRTLRVNEYLNAFDQDWLAVPEGKDLVLRMDRLGPPPEVGESAVFQVAVKTRRLAAEQADIPLAISFVIDVSGSMMGYDKMESTRQSLKEAVMELREGDYVSIVTFNNSARMLVPETRITAFTRGEVLEAIKSMKAMGGTNIQAGLISGYKEMAGFPEGVTRRLLLLTDGRSNVGAISPPEIAEQARVEYREGARISTIGLGHDVDERMLRKIASEGGGHYYFADKAATLTGLLREDLRTTLVPVAGEVQLRLDAGQGYRVTTVHGADPVNNADGSLGLSLGELNAHDWRVLIVEAERVEGEAELPRVSGTFYSFDAEKELSLPVATPESNRDGVNTIVLRNATLYANARALIKAGQLNEERRYEEAIRILNLQLNNNAVLASLRDAGTHEDQAAMLRRAREIIAANAGREAPDTEESMRDEAPSAVANTTEQLVQDSLVLAADTLPGLWSVVARALIRSFN